MAGDWIKIEKATIKKPEIIRLAVALGIRTDEAFGICFRFWSWCDDQVSDGMIRDFSKELIDATVDRPGFASALISVGWLQVRDGSLVIPNFNRHLSHSAKTRAEAAIRKKKERSKPVTKMSQKNVTCVTQKTDENVTIEKRREEKRKNEEEITPTPSFEDSQPRYAECAAQGFMTPVPEDFERFWAAYPRKIKRREAALSWEAAVATVQLQRGISGSVAAEWIISRARELAASLLARGDPQFVPGAAAFLKDERFFDDPKEWELSDDRDRKAGRNSQARTRRAEHEQSNEINDQLAELLGRP